MSTTHLFIDIAWAGPSLANYDARTACCVLTPAMRASNEHSITEYAPATTCTACRATERWEQAMAAETVRALQRMAAK